MMCEKYLNYDSMSISGIPNIMWLGLENETLGYLAILCNMEITEIFVDFLWKS
jgi:hypothetical protein